MSFCLSDAVKAHTQKTIISTVSQHHMKHFIHRYCLTLWPSPPPVIVIITHITETPAQTQQCSQRRRMLHYSSEH